MTEQLDLEDYIATQIGGVTYEVLKDTAVKDLSFEVMRSILSYEPTTGKLYWERRPDQYFPSLNSAAVWNSKFAGKEAMARRDCNGYHSGKIFSKFCAAHRAAWILSYGSWPNFHIDHINGVRHDNRLSNLRSVTPQENSKNVGLRQDNTSGVVGVSLLKEEKKWIAYITVGQKRMHLGRFNEKETAIRVRKMAERTLGFHAMHGQRPGGPN